MADPLSISSGLIGALSFAIQIAQGTVKYYAGFKEAPKELLRMQSELERFDSTTDVLQRAAKGQHVGPDVKETVERLIENAHASVNELQVKIEIYWRDGLEGCVPPTNESEVEDKANCELRKRKFGLTRIKAIKSEASTSLKRHSNQTMDRAKYPLREAQLEKLQRIILNIKADLAMIMPLLPNDAACKTLDEMDFMQGKIDHLREDIQSSTMAEKLDQLRDDIRSFHDQAKAASNESSRVFDQFHSWQSKMTVAGDHDNEDATQRQNEVESKIQGLSEKLQSAFDTIEETAEELRIKVNRIDAKANPIGGAADSVTEQHAFEFEQLLQEIRSTEDDFLSKILKVTSEIEVSHAEMTRIVDEKSKTVREIHENVIPIREEVSIINQRAQADHDWNFLDWLSPLTTGIEEKQRNSFDTWCKQSEAATIFLGSEKFSNWLECSGHALWCLGGPGVGKTILASTIIDRLKKTARQDQALVYFYCDYNEAKKHEPSAYTGKILAHVIRQLALLSSSTHALATLRQRYDTSRGLPDRAEYHEAMLTVAGYHSEIFIIIDGLDECPDRTRLAIFEEFKFFKPKAHFLITSRCKFGGTFDPKLDTSVNIRASDVDIANYVRASTDNFDRFLTKIGDDKPFQEKIVNRIVERANGMFLLAERHTDNLSYMESYYWIEKTLEELPDSLGETYDKVIARMDERNPRAASVATKLITWVAFAETPLTLEELTHAIAVEPEDTCWTPQKVVQRGTLLDICPELFVLGQGLGQGEILKFNHYSVQEHFTSRFSSGQSLLALTCLTYLSLKDFDDISNCHDSYEIAEFMASRPEYTLLEYACCNWGHHAKQIHDERVRKCTIDFLERTYRIMFSIEVIARKCNRKIKEYFNYKNPYHRLSSVEMHSSLSLWIATYFGWYALVAELLSGPKKATYLTYAFQIAIDNYDRDIIRLFIQHGANLNDTDVNDRTTLYRAAELNDQAFALELFDNKTGLSLQSARLTQSPLYVAAKRGNLNIVHLLLERCDDPLVLTKADRHGDTILHLAVMSACVDLVAMLLQRGLDVNAVNNGGETPLVTAVSRTTKFNGPAIQTIVQMLMAKGADVNVSNYAGNTALHYAASKGDVTVLDHLLGQAASIGSTDQLGRTALSLAARSGHCDAVSLLIERGAQVNVRNYELSALWDAIYAKHPAVVDILLQKGADVHQLGLQGDPLLTRLTRYRILDPFIAEQLLDAWADPNVEDRDGLTALDYATRLCSEALRETLVEYGAIESGKRPYDRPQLRYKAKVPLNTLGPPKFTEKARDYVPTSVLLGGKLIHLSEFG